MQIKRALGLGFMSLPEGPVLHSHHTHSLLSGDLLSQRGVATLLFYCETWRERSDVERVLFSCDGVISCCAVPSWLFSF